MLEQLDNIYCLRTVPQSCHWSVAAIQADDQEPDRKSLYCPECWATVTQKYRVSSAAPHGMMADRNFHIYWDWPKHSPGDPQNFQVGRKQSLQSSPETQQNDSAATHITMMEGWWVEGWWMEGYWVDGWWMELTWKLSQSCISMAQSIHPTLTRPSYKKYYIHLKQDTFHFIIYFYLASKVPSRSGRFYFLALV